MKNNFRTFIKQFFCKHKQWICDTQIRVIECKKCGKRAWIKEYKDLFTNK